MKFAHGQLTTKVQWLTRFGINWYYYNRAK